MTKATDTTCADDVLVVLRDVLEGELAVPGQLVIPDAHVFRDLGLDSVDLLTVVIVLEDRLGVTILDEDIPHMLVVRDAVALLLDRLGAG